MEIKLVNKHKCDKWKQSLFIGVNIESIVRATAKCWGVSTTCDVLDSRGVAIFLVASLHRNRNKQWHCWAFWLLSSLRAVFNSVSRLGWNCFCCYPTRVNQSDEKPTPSVTCVFFFKSSDWLAVLFYVCCDWLRSVLLWFYGTQLKTALLSVIMFQPVQLLVFSFRFLVWSGDGVMISTLSWEGLEPLPSVCLLVKAFYPHNAYQYPNGKLLNSVASVWWTI